MFFALDQVDFGLDTVDLCELVCHDVVVVVRGAGSASCGAALIYAGAYERRKRASGAQAHASQAAAVPQLISVKFPLHIRP